MFHKSFNSVFVKLIPHCFIIYNFINFISARTNNMQILAILESIQQRRHGYFWGGLSSNKRDAQRCQCLPTVRGKLPGLSKSTAVQVIRILVQHILNKRIYSHIIYIIYSNAVRCKKHLKQHSLKMTRYKNVFLNIDSTCAILF